MSEGTVPLAHNASSPVGKPATVIPHEEKKQVPVVQLKISDSHPKQQTKEQIYKSTVYICIAIAALLLPCIMLYITCKKASDGSGNEVDLKRAKSYE